MISSREVVAHDTAEAWEVVDDAYPGLGYGVSYAVRVPRAAGRAMVRAIAYDGTESTDAFTTNAVNSQAGQWNERQGE